MKLTNPSEIRDTIAEVRGWTTIKQISEELGISMNTANRAFRGLPVRYTTVYSLAGAINKRPGEIAVEVDNNN